MRIWWPRWPRCPIPGAAGIRHRLVTVLAVAVCAVLAGARSYVAIAEWAHDLPLGARMRLGIGRRAAQRVHDPPDAAEVDPTRWISVVGAGWPTGSPDPPSRTGG